MSDVTRLLQSIEDENEQAADRLLPLVYEELRKLARARLATEKSGHTLQPTELVHEAYLRLVGRTEINWNGRGHFFGAASEAMRRILIDRARRRQSAKHGGDRQTYRPSGRTRSRRRKAATTNFSVWTRP